MPNSPSKALPLCISTLMVGGVFVLQNAEYYSGKLRDTGHPAAIWTADALTTAAEYSGLAEFNISQRNWLDKWIALGTGEEITDEDETEESEETPAPDEQDEPEVTPPPAPAPVQHTVLDVSDDETDPLPGATTAPTGEEPPAPLLEDAPNPLDSAKPLPWPVPEPEPAPAPIIDDVIEPTPPPAPLVDDVVEPDPAPSETPTTTEEPQPTPTEETVTDNTDDAGATETQATDTQADSSDEPVHCKIMLMGDSLMEDLGPRTHRRMRTHKGLQFVLSAKYSTGLCRSDFFDWPAHMREAIAEHKPNILVVFIGANDGQPIKHGNTFIQTNDPRWHEIYGAKMQEIVDIANQHGTKVLWVGLPVIGNRYTRLLVETARAQKAHCERNGIHFIDSNITLADENGQFLAYKKDRSGKIVRLRRQDKVHLSPEGNHALIDQVQPIIEKTIKEFSAEHPELRLTEDEKKQEWSARLAVTVKYTPSSRAKKKKKK